MRVLYSGLPHDAVKLLKAGIDYAYKGLKVGLEPISLDLLPIQVLEAHQDPGVIYVVLDSTAEEECKDIANDTLESVKFLRYEDTSSFRELLMKNLSIPEDEMPKATQLMGIGSLVGVDGEFGNVGGFNGFSEELLNGVSSGDSIEARIIANLAAQLGEMRELLEYVGKADLESAEGVPSEQGYQVSPDHENTVAQLKDEIKRLEDRNSSLESELSEKEVKLSDLYTTLANHDKMLQESQNTNTFLESQNGGWKEEKDSLLAELDSTRGKLLRVQGENDSLKKANTDLNGELQSVKTSLKDGGRETAELRKMVQTLEEKYEISLNSNSELKDKLSSVTSVRESLESQVEDLSKSNSRTSNALVEANQEIVNLKGQLKGYELSGKGMSEQGKQYSDLYEDYLKLKADIFCQIGSNSFPKAFGVVSLDNLTTSLSRSRNIGFLFTGSGESQRSVYKYLREELSVARSGLATKTTTPLIKPDGLQRKVLLVDLSTESSLDYVFEVQGNLKSSWNWWKEGGSLKPYVNPTGIRGVEALVFGNNFNNDSYLLKVDWESRIRELDQSGYTVIFLGANIANLIGRVIFNSARGTGKAVLALNGLITQTRNALVNMQGFECDELDVVVIERTKSSEALYRYLETIVSTVQYYN